MLPLSFELFTLKVTAITNKMDEVLSVLPMCKLRTLSVPSLSLCLTRCNEMSLVINLTVDSHCNGSRLNDLFKYAPLLKYLHIPVLFDDTSDISNHNDAIHLKKLTIGRFSGQFEDYKMFAKQTPNLKSLTISIGGSFENMGSADEWKIFIISSLPYLKVFMFNFKYYYKTKKEVTIDCIFQQFQNDFWLIEHPWHTMCALRDCTGFIFTTPYYSDTSKTHNHINKYLNQSIQELL